MLVKFENESIEVQENEEHMFLVSNYEVAKGYGISEVTLRRHKSSNESELVENKHFIFIEIETNGGKQRKLFWTKRGVIRLGFFIKSERAKKFRDWAEDLILNSIEQKVEAEIKEDHQENQVFPQMEFVFMINDQLRVSHCSIAEEIDYDEKLIRNTITKHFEYLEKYGEVYFESEPRINSAGAINYKKIYFLNEQQSSSLFNYIRNSEKVEKYKAILIKEFAQKREKILLSNLTRIQNSKSFDFASLEDLKKYTEFNQAMIDLIKLVANQENNTLIYLDKVSKNLNYKSAVELLEIKL